ncbi:uncharacterized protein B0T15DRAFT_218682 [Chaetomium strumarium]|uniref:Uncharacterized protein n=1 Tax=Chaetomium strumarium TaxID=1170767 RepID=A0AAJ0GUJ9_9PEZI|nr:hypothetical protein B0T15DRAFT_218682 [Chaetomium strumarium]
MYTPSTASTAMLLTQYAAVLAFSGRLSLRGALNDGSSPLLGSRFHGRCRLPTGLNPLRPRAAMVPSWVRQVLVVVRRPHCDRRSLAVATIPQHAQFPSSSAPPDPF